MKGADLIDLDAGLRDLASVLLEEETLATALQRISTITCRCVAVDAGASVVLRQRGRLYVASATDERARSADEAQLEAQQGPCMAAFSTRTVVDSPDLLADERWPDLARAEAVSRDGLRSALSAPFVVRDDVVGALNMYSTNAGEFTEGTRESARLLATQAAVTVANVIAHDVCRERVDQLQQALDSRVVIEQAKGVLMERERCDADTAFNHLRERSQRSNRRLRLVAEEVVVSAGAGSVQFGRG